MSIHIKTQNTLLNAFSSMFKKISFLLFWKKHLLFKIVPPTTGLTGSRLKPEDVWSLGCGSVCVESATPEVHSPLCLYMEGE